MNIYQVLLCIAIAVISYMLGKRKGVMLAGKAFLDATDRFVEEMKSRKAKDYTIKPVQFETSEKAHEILRMLRGLIKTYGVARISDFYEIAGEQGVYTDNTYGWTDLSEATVIKYQDKFQIEFPRALPLV